MEDQTDTFTLNGSKDVIDLLYQDIIVKYDANCRLVERKNLNGDTASWILIATIANQSLPHILKFIKEYLNGKQVKKIKCKGLLIENPTPELLEEFLKNLKAESKSKHGKHRSG